MVRKRRVGNLPRETKHLVGRHEELAQVARLCGRSRLVTVTGLGGVGKTRLALRTAAGLQSHFADGAWLVELSSLNQGRGLPYAIGQALPLTDETTRPMSEVVAEYLADREILLVMDTCEHLVEDCGMVIEVLLRAAPRLRILATSRRPLHLAAEEVFTLDPLPVPEADAAGAGETEADAVLLLAERAAEAVPGFTVTAADRAEAVALCRRLEGLPLAIELAAARLGEWPLAELNRRLADRFAVLGNTEDEDYEADPHWHQALRTAIGWSHELCTPTERLLWARLSVFAGGFDTEAASRVCADGPLPGEEVPGLLQALVEKSLLIWVPAVAGERYRMLDTIREFGAFWLRGLGEEEAVRRRHRDHYLALAQAGDAAWRGPGQVAWRDRLAAEHANLRTALDFCLTDGDGHTALKLGGTLWFDLFARGFPKEGQHCPDRAPALGTACESARAQAVWARGLTALAQGDAETAGRLAGILREAVAEDTDPALRRRPSQGRQSLGRRSTDAGRGSGRRGAAPVADGRV
ncbi:ATP-binding protein [Streptomyces poonensis]|uniref:LuxR family transcriptional regulator n=1 Tax=Streptomyces poonensis TaxID=68255 RepID=A0A918PYJ3_9ACTN|nr:hypothetical protein [Streptomyces poonensis]GGZ27311.1 hypothetical protein GCM10010365_54400 [Streptomyces poonensis]GLJ93831.1 hypothetical protein GCM10017589_64480 [Streptomyces poonensis]